MRYYNLCEGGRALSIAILLVFLVFMGGFVALSDAAVSGNAWDNYTGDVNITKIGHFGGSTYAVGVSGNYAYTSQGSDFFVLDISNKTLPVEIERVETRGIIREIALAGNYAYVADQENGLVILDVGNPAAPTRKGSYDKAVFPLGVAVMGNYTYAIGENGLVIFRMDTISNYRVHNINTSINYTTIQSAIDNASAGDEIQVDNGIYFENVNVTKQLTLRGIGMPVVDARGIRSAITLSADGITLVGFNATGGNSTPEAGIRLISSNNTLIGNKVSSNDNGISILSSSNNTIYNNYFNNSQNVFYDGKNIWNITKTVGTNIIGGPFLGGNFWAHPDRIGFSQTCNDGNKDGICDSRYTLDSSNIDNLPLTTNKTTEAPTESPTSTNSAVPTEIPTVTPTKKAAGFTVLMAISILLLSRRSKKIQNP